MLDKFYLFENDGGKMKIQCKCVKDIVSDYIDEVECTGLYNPRIGCSCKKDRDIFYCLYASVNHPFDFLECVPSNEGKL